MSAVFRTPDDRFGGLSQWPHEPQYVEVADPPGLQEPLRLARVDEGPADAQPVLLLHGEPTSSYLYRGVFPDLLDAGLRVVAPDHAGFGRSDKPTDREWYSYDRHVQLLTALVDRLDLHRVTLVVHDWGGPIGLRWAMEHPDRVARIAILNTGLYGGAGPTPGFLAWLAYARAHPDLPVGTLVGKGSGGLAEDVVAAYDAPFPTAESKAGAAAFPLLVPTSVDAPGAAQMQRTARLLEAWDGPVQVAFGDRDPIFPVDVGLRWTERLRRAEPFRPIEGAGHFVAETHPGEVAGAILDLVRRHPL